MRGEVPSTVAMIIVFSWDYYLWFIESLKVMNFREGCPRNHFGEVKLEEHDLWYTPIECDPFVLGPLQKMQKINWKTAI